MIVGFAFTDEHEINWVLCALVLVFAYLGRRAEFDIPGFTVQDSGTPALAISAFLLGPGPAVSVAVVSVVLMPECLARLCGRDVNMSAAAIPVNAFASAAPVLAASLLFELLPKADLVQLTGAIGLYLFIEVVASALAIAWNYLLGVKSGVAVLIGLLGPILVFQLSNAMLVATVVVVFEHAPLAAVLLGLVVGVSCVLLQAQVFHAGTVAEQARQRTDELGAHQLEVLHTMMSAFDQRDPDLAAHSRAVSALGRRVATLLQLPVAEQQLVEVAGLLHDIGKFAVADDLRAGRHVTGDDPAENFPALGAQIIAPLSGYGPVGAVIAAQTAPFRPDPGDSEPPIAARVVAVADAYDSMVSGSAQARALGPHAALARLRAQSGRRFDPQVVDAISQVAFNDDLHPQIEPEQMADRWRALTNTAPVQLTA